MARARLQMIRGVALQQTNLDRPIAVTIANAGALAENFRGADPGATAAENVLLQYGQGGPGHITRSDGADKAGYVDARGTGADAGCVVTKITTVGIDQRSGRVQGPVHVGEIFRQRHST